MTAGPRRELVDPVRAAVARAVEAVGPGLFGVACSGGADSIALAHAAIATVGASHVVIVTIDHGLQPTSARVAAEVAAWARGQGAAAVIEPVVVPRRPSVEAAAREARYAALEAIADRSGLAVVWLGHTARDQAETVLMRILRGTGPGGLAGIPATRGRFARPLLALERAEVERYVARHALPVWDDPMNQDDRLTRVRIRRHVLPMLRAENPRLDEALIRLATSAAEWAEVIDAAASPFAQLPIDCVALAALPAAVRKRALAVALERASVRVDAGHLDELDRLVVAPSRGRQAIDVPGVRLVRSYAVLDVERPDAVVALVPPAGPYQLRPWTAGDRMRPARLAGRSRKLSDLFIDAKVPRGARASARVLVAADGEIVWAEHVGVAFGADPRVIPKPA